MSRHVPNDPWDMAWTRTTPMTVIAPIFQPTVNIHHSRWCGILFRLTARMVSFVSFLFHPGIGYYRCDCYVFNDKFIQQHLFHWQFTRCSKKNLLLGANVVKYNWTTVWKKRKYEEHDGHGAEKIRTPTLYVDPILAADGVVIFLKQVVEGLQPKRWFPTISPAVQCLCPNHC